MSSDEDDGLVRFGTPLDPIEEDEAPAKKITLADQIVVDENGKRRFHGAFTGGFAAGYWNTVGSKEGWQPAEFKSSRQEKAAQRIQKASDFMDEEDVGEFGIAPQRIQTTDDFGPTQDDSRNKRKRAPSKVPIPGIPVLELVLESFRDKAAVRLLRRMDEKYAKNYLHRSKLKQEKSDGNKELATTDTPVTITMEDDKESKAEEGTIDDHSGNVDSQSRKVYQCDMGPIARLPVPEANSDSEDNDTGDAEDMVFDEDEFDAIFRNMKIDRFGLSYTGLENGNFFSVVGADAPVRQNAPLSSFTMVDKHNKRVTIRGQAFGVGAFEEDDDDIYGRDDLTKYDFQMGNQSDNSSVRQKTKKASQQFIDGFDKCSVSMGQRQAKAVFRVNVPNSFEPRNWLKRKSRFGPQVIASTSKESSNKVVGRHDMTPAQRGNILNDRKLTTVHTEPELVWVAPSEAVPTQIDTRKMAVDVIKPKSFLVPDSIPNIFNRFTSSNDTKAGDTQPVQKIDPPTVLEKPKEVKKVTRTRFSWEPCQLLCYKMNMETAVGTKPDKSKTFSLFECINVGSIAKKKNSMEFEKSVHKDDTEEADREKIAERNRQRLSTLQTMPSASEARSSQASSSSQTSHTNSSLQSVDDVKSIVRHSLKPKTELEKKIFDAKDDHPSKKIDLFKAVFDSDSESDDNNEAADDTLAESTKEFMASLGKQTASTATPSFRAHLPDNPFAPKSAKELNILRNTSPPRGIFRSLIDTNELLANARAADLQRRDDAIKQGDDQQRNEDDAYGPSLPPTIQPSSSTHKKQPSVAPSSMHSDIHFKDDWVERSRDRTPKKSKKEKKDKHKEKKSKKEKLDKHKSKKSKKDKHKNKKR